MKLRLFKHILAATFIASMWVPTSNAAIITDTMGNGASGLVDGTAYGLVPDILNAQAGQAAPFDAGYGGLFSSFDVSWVHSFGAIADTIVSASLTIGLYEHDPGSPGDQVESFLLDGNAMTGTLNGLFNVDDAGGANGETSGVYNEYTIDLAAMLADLADGIANLSLALQGPEVNPGLFGGPSVEQNNGAHIIFSTLNIVTRDGGTPPGQIPEPGILSLILAGGLLLVVRRKVQ